MSVINHRFNRSFVGTFVSIQPGMQKKLTAAPATINEQFKITRMNRFAKSTHMLLSCQAAWR
jgi:hypothetical protein